jgi:hypothetical protein
LVLKGQRRTGTRRKYVTKAVSTCESSSSIIAGDLSEASFERVAATPVVFCLLMGQGSRSYRPADYVQLQIMAGKQILPGFWF